MNLYEMDSASKYINRAQLDKALTSDLYCIKGNMNLYKYNFQTALKLFKRSNLVNPKNSEALNGIGMCYLQMEEPLKAVPYFEKGLKNNPESYSLLNNLGLAYHHAGQYYKQIEKHDTAKFYFQKALETFDFAATKKPESFAYCMNNKGLVFKDMNESDSALKCFNYMYNIATLNNKAIVYANQNQQDTAYQLFTTAISLDPKRYELRSNRAQINKYSNILQQNSDNEFLSTCNFKPRRSSFSTDNYCALYYFMYSDPIETYIVEDFEVEFAYTEPQINEVYAHDLHVFAPIKR